MPPDDLKGILELNDDPADLLLRHLAVAVLLDVPFEVSVLAVLKHQVDVPAALLVVH